VWGEIIKVAETESKIVSARYARALFSLAGESRQLDGVEQDFRHMAEALRSSAEFVAFIRNPLINRADKAQAMDAILAKLKASDLARRFVKRLALNQRLSALPQIIAAYSDLLAEQRGVARAEVTAAAPLSQAQLSQLQAALAKALGKQVSLAAREDSSLLGGVRIKVGDLMLDGSLAGKLSRLQAAMRQTIH